MQKILKKREKKFCRRFLKNERKKPKEFYRRYSRVRLLKSEQRNSVKDFWIADEKFEIEQWVQIKGQKFEIEQ